MSASILKTVDMVDDESSERAMNDRTVGEAETEATAAKRATDVLTDGMIYVMLAATFCAHVSTFQKKHPG
jgi:DeoR/GlpR family transcriptional regulator of sugar metabolism